MCKKVTEELGNRLVKVSIESEMKRSYLDYAMSVIVARALPDVRDGLKPVHRRIIYAMHQTNNYHDKPYKKSARVVGEVIGKYHPHGNDPIYMAIVRMAQDFSMREMLIDGQGNFGSMDGDMPAAMRYTEVRLAKIAQHLLSDIEQDTVDFMENYDGSEEEPKVLPARFPNILVNGSSGIAVGMATNIPPHNLHEVLTGCIAIINNPDITAEELSEIIPAPDFPTGGAILGAERAKIALRTGRGSIILRAKIEQEEIGGHQAIIVKEMPYQVNKAELVKKIEDLSRNKLIEGISELRDESNKLGVRVVIELKKDAHPEIVINQLYKNTELQTSFGVNLLVLNKGVPMQMGIKEVLENFVEFRKEVVTRRCAFELMKARKRAHTLIGLHIAVSNIDEVIKLIKSSPTPSEAKVKLMASDWLAVDVVPLLKLVDDYRNEVINDRCKFTEEQADAILEMKLARLTGLEKNKIENELAELGKSITELLEILNSAVLLTAIVVKELEDIRDAYGTKRRTEIVEDASDIDIEDLIQKEDMVVTTTYGGFIKRVPLATYRAQRRGGKGRSAMSTHGDDITTDVIVANTHTPLLFFSSIGKVYRMKLYKIPMQSTQSKGKAFVNLLPLQQGETITNIVPLPENTEAWKELTIMFATARGNIRRNDLDIFSNINAGGKIAIKLDEGDKLIGVGICNASDHILMAASLGKAIRFPVDTLRVFKSRSSDGVRGMKLANAKDEVISMSILPDAKVDIEKREEFLRIADNIRIECRIHSNKEMLAKALSDASITLTLLNIDEVMELALKERYVLTITENGYGKRTSVYEYRITARGGQGVTNIDVSERNGNVVTSQLVGDTEHILVLTDAGKLIRTSVKDIRITGRNAKGVKIINASDNEKVKSVTVIADDTANDDEEVEINADN